jgi:hypothetical protein
MNFGHEGKTLDEHIDATIKSVADAMADTKLEVKEIGVIVGGFAACVAHVFYQNEDMIKHKQEIKDSLHSAYNKHIRPIDLKQIPNWIEPTFDSIVEAQIDPIVDGLAAAMFG